MSMFGRLLLLVIVLVTLCVPRASVPSGASQVSVDQIASLELGAALAAEGRTALSPTEQPTAPTLPPLLWLGSSSWFASRSAALAVVTATATDESFPWRSQRVCPFNRERGPPRSS